MFQCWSCEGEFTVDAPDRETWYTCPHCEIDNEYDGARMVGTKPALVQKLDAYNEANLARYTAKHFRNEAASDQVAIAQSERNAHTSIGGIIVGSLFTAGLYLPIVLAMYLLGALHQSATRSRSSRTKRSCCSTRRSNISSWSNLVLG